MDIKKQFAQEALQQGVNMTALCKRFGISKPTGYKWKKRYQSDGERGLDEHSRRPKDNPNQLEEKVVCELVRLGQAHPTWGPKKIRVLYQRMHGESPSLTSVQRVFDRAGLVKKRKRGAPVQGGRLHSQAVAEGPNDVWTVDFKGWWRTKDKDQCIPLTVRDEYSRYVLCAYPVDEANADKVRECFEKLFEDYGLPKRIRSDNGSPFACTRAVMGLSTLSVWWLALGINLERSRPGKPQDNGAHERMHRDIKAEVQSCAQGSVKQQRAAMEIWRKSFNEERPHEALGHRSPCEVYKPSERKWKGTPEDLEYPSMIKRKVVPAGWISYEGQRYPISGVLSGWSVGLKAVSETKFDVYFAETKLGQIDVETAAFVGAGTGPHEEQPSTQEQVTP